MFIEWKFVKLVAQSSHCINEKKVKKIRLWCFLKSLSHPKSPPPSGSNWVTYSIGPLRDMHVMKIALQHDHLWPQWSLTVTLRFTVACEKVTFPPFSSTRPSAYLLRSIQQYDTATRAKESKNKETAPALADITTLLASSRCLFGSTFSVTWLFPYLSLNPLSKGGCRAEPLGVIDIDRNHCCR